MGRDGGREGGEGGRGREGGRREGGREGREGGGGREGEGMIVVYIAQYYFHCL